MELDSMKPHMAHIAETMIRKELAVEAKNPKTSYTRYCQLVDRARAGGYSDADIIKELKEERKRISDDKREGDPLFQEGVHNSKVSCLHAISLIISELEGEK